MFECEFYIFPNIHFTYFAFRLVLEPYVCIRISSQMKRQSLLIVKRQEDDSEVEGEKKGGSQ